MAYWPHFYLLLLVLIIWALEKKFPKAVDKAEENILIFIVAAIMVVSFVQVIARYGFNSGWSAALEFNTIGFSWMILLGMGYGIKNGSHLGVDIVLNAVSKPVAKGLALFGAAGSMFYGLILLDSSWVAWLGVDVRGGAIEYWAKMWKVGIGAEELHYPQFLQDAFGLQTRIHRWLILVVLPISLALLSFRSLQAFVDIWNGHRRTLIAGHEAEELVEENKDALKD